jgi:hypothetical protein
MGKLGVTEVIILLFILFLVFAIIPIIAYRVGYKSGRVRGERDAFEKQNQINRNL